MNKNIKCYMTAIIGVVLLGAGFYTLKTQTDPSGIMKTLPYILMGLGCGIFGGGMGEIISKNVMRKHPEMEREAEIESNDERNIAISNKAKSKAFDVMTYLLGALMITFALMNVELAATLLLAFAYLFIEGYAIYFRNKYDKEM